MPISVRLSLPLLLLVFQLAQAVLLTHGYELHAHPGEDEPCELCLHAAHGKPALFAAMAVPAPTPAAAEPATPPAGLNERTPVAAYAARAPPFALPA